MGIPHVGSYDVVVVGSGAAGSPAAIAAARAGASALLIEKLPFLGGNSTAVLDTFYGFYTPGSRERKVVGGIGDDVVRGLEQHGPVIRRPNTYGAGTGVTYVADHLKVVWEDLVQASGADVLLHAFVQDVVTHDGRISELVVATKAGLVRYSASVVVDASGDADVCFQAGFGFELAGEIAPAQTLTTTFRMINVDHEARAAISKDELHELMADAADSGDYELPRREGSDHITPIDGMTATVMTRLDQVEEGAGGVRNATDPAILTRAEIEGRRQALEYARFLVDKVPGYTDASLVGLASQIGLRETRRVYGDYRITKDDVVTATQFEDQIGLCGAPIEDHHGEGVTGTTWVYLPDGEVVGIPLRTLIARDGVNTLIAGRCFSAEHDAQASIRSMAQCMAMGQAVGTTAALATRSGGDVRSVPFGDLAETLEANGAILSLGSDR
ncbi:MAG: FAD-dependent oxidoreductase [Acidimicrobiia bacterium]